MGTTPMSALIADSQPQACLRIADALGACGFDCHSVICGSEARELLEFEAYALLIADIALPDVSGLDLLAFGRTRVPWCKVVLTAARPHREWLAQALVFGAYDYIDSD